MTEYNNEINIFAWNPSLSSDHKQTDVRMVNVYMDHGVDKDNKLDSNRGSVWFNYSGK